MPVIFNYTYMLLIFVRVRPFRLSYIMDHIGKSTTRILGIKLMCYSKVHEMQNKILSNICMYIALLLFDYKYGHIIRFHYNKFNCIDLIEVNELINCTVWCYIIVLKTQQNNAWFSIFYNIKCTFRIKTFFLKNLLYYSYFCVSIILCNIKE